MPDIRHSPDALQLLLDLARQARQAESAPSLQFQLVNQTISLVPYLISLLWVEEEGVVLQSGVSHVERNSPFMLFVNEIFGTLAEQNSPCAVNAGMLQPSQLTGWREYLPEHAVWIPLNGYRSRAALLIARDVPFSHEEFLLLCEWVEIWSQSWSRLVKPSTRGELKRHWLSLSGVFKRSRWKWVILIIVAIIPVRLTVLAPGELVPSQPALIRVPFEGVIDEMYVSPNERVTSGQPLFRLDLTSLTSKLQVARQETQIATQEYRQSALQSLTDPKSRGQLAAQEGKAAERKIEADYLNEILEKAKIDSPRNGTVIFDDPSEWIGKPVVSGEKVMVVAVDGDVEIQAWLPVSDALEVPVHSPVTMYLNAAPFSPVAGIVRYMGHEPIQRPDGSYAYRIRAKLASEQKGPRVGLKGTVKISGQFVPLLYWVLRKPLASFRQFTGI